MQLRQIYWELRGLGFDTAAAVSDPPESNGELRERLNLPYSILSDPGAETARQYGVFHDNEPRGRDIARVSVFLIDSSDNQRIVRWEYVSPTHHHRAPPSRLMEEAQKMAGRTRQIVSVILPTEAALLTLEPGSGDRLLEEEVVMGQNTEIHRLLEEGWDLSEVSPETDGTGLAAQRFVFRKDFDV